MASFQESLISIRFAKALLEVEPDVADLPNARPIKRARGDVELRNVGFAYHGRHAALQGVSFKVGAGEVVGIVGPTGAGKSTLVSMLPRFLDPSEGSVLLDGHDLRALTVASVRDQISLVQQEPLLFPRSIAENIRYGRLDATDEEIMNAARGANAHEFITALPQGYATKLGERGAKISGGERQRITIARAFLKDAPVLILDEPTSSVDSHTEAVILEALERLMEGRTTFIVAHRLSTLRNADRIVVINGGEVVEQGSHASLMATGGLYATLHALQGGQPSPTARGDGSPGSSTAGGRAADEAADAADHEDDAGPPGWTPPPPPSWARPARRGRVVAFAGGDRDV
jgi:ABC-type multidrug transport system fused ATPase/permease subunit